MHDRRLIFLDRNCEGTNDEARPISFGGRINFDRELSERDISA